MISDWTPETLTKMSDSDRLWCLVALRRIDLKEEKWVQALWNDRDPAIRFEVLRWIADGVLTSFTEKVEQRLKSPDIDYNLFEAALAAWKLCEESWRGSYGPRGLGGTAARPSHA